MTGFLNNPDWVAWGARVNGDDGDEDHYAVFAGRHIHQINLDVDANDVMTTGSHAPVFTMTTVTMTARMGEYEMRVSEESYSEAASHLDSLITHLTEAGTLAHSLHTLYELAAEHVSTKEQAAALEKVADYLGY